MNTYWPDLRHRELVGEVMDDPTLPEREHLRALKGLQRINAISRTAEAFFRQLLLMLGSESDCPTRILDVACGDGDNAVRLARLARRHGLDWRVDGCDVSERAVAFAQNHAAQYDVNAGFFVADALGGLPTDGYDAVINALFLHHLEDDQIVLFLQQLHRFKHVVISDLVRSRRAYLATVVGVRLLSRSRVVHLDGPLSVRAAMTVDELSGLAQASGLRGAQVQRCWPMRQRLTWSQGR